MAKQSPSLYSISKTFIWFTVTSLILTGTLVATVLMDHNREWKKYQNEFNRLKLKMAQDELKTASAGVDKKKLAELEKKHADAVAAFKSAKASYDKLVKESDASATQYAKVKAEYQSLKQFQDSYKYYVEEYRLHKDPKSAEMERKLSETTPKVLALKTRQDAIEKEKEAKDKQIAALQQAQNDSQKEIDKLLEQKTLVEKRIGKLKPSLVKDVLNAPMLDFVAPTLKVQQLVLDDLQDDYHFARVQKVDRCTTCHLGIDQKGFENAPQPFRTHPNLDLFLSSSSKHPIEKIGCTSCHGGSGQAVSFVESVHTPRDEKQEEEWVKKHNWKEFHHWENPMLPLQHVEAGCVKCHRGVTEVPQAKHLNEGRKLAETYGCFECHKMKDFKRDWKVGPDLKGVKGKLSEEWMAKWIEDPKSFRPSTKMPQIFHLSNTSSPDDKVKNEAAIRGIVAYLMKHSEPAALTAGAPKAGDAAKGEQLVKTLGCLGCHSGAGVEAGHHGPELSGLGSKVSAEWLYNWLKNPKHLSPETRMPDLRLTDEEASDLTAYLLSLKNEAFEKKTVPQAQEKAVNSLLLESMEGTMRRSEAEAELSKMSSDEKLLALGKRTIAHQGCFACHSINGFEDAKPIGAELSDEGRKDVHKFDFGFVHIEENRQAWIEQKLKDPRIFDQGKIKAYYEKLRMPQFNFTDEEIEALTTFVLSQTEEQVPMPMQKRLDLNEQSIEKGRLLVSKLNCQGCHALDGHPGTLRELNEDKGAAPPILDGEGAKVQEKWLHEFLKAPTPIRTWLTYRMPTFDLSEEELQTIVYYFHHLAKQEVSFAPDSLPPSDEVHLKAGESLFGTLQCAKCHEVTPETAAMGTSFLAPDLGIAKKRLKPEWVQAWLRDPQMLQEGTMMPTFFPDGQSPVTDVLEGDAEAQIKAIRDYLYRYESASSKENSTK